MSIRFGTSGWHAVLADDFTSAGVPEVTEASCPHFGEADHINKAMVVGYETPVGFKYGGGLINDNKIILGGEESAGLSIKGHYPEKDGIPACVLAAEAVAPRGTSLTD